jgi:hypothetical protein
MYLSIIKFFFENALAYSASVSTIHLAPYLIFSDETPMFIYVLMRVSLPLTIRKPFDY